MIKLPEIKFTCKLASELGDDEKERLGVLFQANNFTSKQTEFATLDHVALAELGRDIVGFRRFKKHVFSNASGERHHCFQCCDTVTDVKYRGQQISSRLLDAFKSEIINCSFLFNFPNNMSLPVYRKMGFHVIDYNLTILKRGLVTNYLSEDVLIDKKLSDTGHLYRYRLRQGILSKIPFFAFGKAGNPKPYNNRKLYLLNVSMAHMWEQNQLATLKSTLCLLRPVTFFPMCNDVNPKKISVTATSFDSLK
jgi:GNAT superfamily N-acetyltransferase